MSEPSSVPATEKAPLLGQPSSEPLQHQETSSVGSSDQSEGAQRLWEELDHPWPSTFERSIGLLASPLIPREQVDLYTKSPKPGSTPAAFARRTNLDRGFYTPDHSTLLLPQNRYHLTDSERFEGPSLAKVQSLDFAPKLRLPEGQDSAKAYRAKILAQQQQKAKRDSAKSPGFGREMASLARTKKQQQQQQSAAPKLDEHGMPISAEKSTIAQSAFNLANILMGVGLLGLPFSFKVAGFAGGATCLMVFGLFAWRTTLLIGQELNGDPRPSAYFDESPFKSPLPPGSTPAARMLPPISSFPDIARASFGEAGCWILSIILYFELFSCICIFFVTMGDHLHQLFPSVPVSVFMMMVAAISVGPAILLRTPTLLSYLSMVGTVATVCVCSSVVMTQELAQQRGMTQQPSSTEQPYHIWWDSSGITLSLGLVAYCFSGHAIVPSIYTSMKEPQQFDYMVTVTFAGVVACCMAVGVAGYYMFGSLVADQVTLSMEEAIEAPLMMKSLVWLMVLTAFSKTTLTMFPLALGMEEVIAPYLTSQTAIGAASAAIKIILTIMALIVSIYVPSFSYICALVGMICTMSVSIIFPAMAHLKMFGPRLSAWEKFLDWIFILVGLFMAVAGTIVTI